MTGIIVSNKMEKTLVVMVYTTKTHPKYKKRYKSRKKYKVHCQDSTKFKINQTVEIKECRPISREKKWIIVE
jgi:small subunit ribosomal protein S17